MTKNTEQTTCRNLPQVPQVIDHFIDCRELYIISLSRVSEEKNLRYVRHDRSTTIASWATPSEYN
jgi:hypothetical protein